MKINIIAGPCSAESRGQVLETAKALHSLGITTFRAGIWKPRSRPGSFEGAGAQGLEWLREVKDTLGMKVGCEVATAEHVEQCLRSAVDFVWIGARTTTSPFMVQEIADALSGSGLKVLVKNPVSPDLGLWLGAFERLRARGITDLVAVHRGVSPLQKIQYRNDPAWQMAIGLRSREPGIPVLCDPSHMGGSSAYVRELSQTALDLGFDGLMIETHCAPGKALSDAGQQLSPAELQALMDGPDKLVVRDGTDSGRSIEALRARIDVIDDSLIALLGQRMDVSRQIGDIKKNGNIAILQSGRWDAVMDRVVKQGPKAGLSEEFIRSVFTEIHKESVSVQKK